MVHPRHRRQHIGSGLLDAAMDELRRRGVGRVLLIVDRSCGAGVGFAAARGGLLESSEHRMRQEHAPELQGAYEQMSVRPAVLDDLDFVRHCTAGGFGLPEEAVDRDDWAERVRQTIVIKSAGTRVGVIRVDRDEVAHDAGIYGFVIVPELQGRGYGRGALSTITRTVRSEGIDSVHLEVLVDNPAALYLYESCGFVSTGVEDYYLVER
jgi:ribosomal protein S18 acetylase RimI-like enzyme